MSVPFSWLEPIADGSNEQHQLFGVFDERPVSNLREDSTPLGRGEQTGMGDLTATFDGYNNRASATMRATPRVSFTSADLHVNGLQVEGQSRVSLSCDFASVNNNIKIEQNVRNSNSGTTSVKRSFACSDPFDTSAANLWDDLFTSPMSPLSVPGDDDDDAEEEEESEGVTLSKDNVTKVNEEIQCCVCLEIQVLPRTLNPCGHSFCSPCVKRLKSCPQCREKIKSHVPARMLDNLICTLVTVPNLLPKDDVQSYHERKKDTEKKIAIARKRHATRKRQRTAEQATSTQATTNWANSLAQRRQRMNEIIQSTWAEARERQLQRNHAMINARQQQVAQQQQQQATTTSPEEEQLRNHGMTQADPIYVD